MADTRVDSRRNPFWKEMERTATKNRQKEFDDLLEKKPGQIIRVKGPAPYYQGRLKFIERK